MSGGEQRLEAASGADVKRACDRATHREVGESHRSTLDAGDVVSPSRGARLWVVGREQQVVVWDELYARSDEAAREVEEPHPLETLEWKRRERSLRLDHGHGRFQCKQQGDRPERAAFGGVARRCSGRSAPGGLPRGSSPSASRTASPW